MRIAFLPMVLPVIVVGCGPHYKYQEPLDAGNGRRIHIYAQTSWECGQGLYLEIRKDGEVLVPVRFFDTRSPGIYEPTYVLLKPEQGDMVAVVEQSELWVVHALHDFAAGRTWSSPLESYDAGAAMLKDLQVHYPDMRLVLSGSN